MKKNILAILGIVLLVGVFQSCSDDDDEKDIKEPLYEFKEGDVVNREIEVGERLIKLEDVITNIGTPDFPILFSINTKCEYSHEDMEGMVFTTTREELDSFIEKWAVLKNMPTLTADDRGMVSADFFNALINENIDINLFIDMCVHEKVPLSELMGIVSPARSEGTTANQRLMAKYQSLCKVNRSKMESVPELKGSSKVPVKKIKGIIKGVIDLFEVWIDFSENNQPVEKDIDHRCSFLAEDDLNEDHYSCDRYFQGETIKLKYWVSKRWHSKFEYYVSGYTGSHPKYQGSYIPMCNIRSTFVEAKGPAFVSEGFFKFSNLINSSVYPGDPVVDVDGMVQVTYGDCCLFRFISYLNFNLNGKKGYEVLSFSDGWH